MMNDAPVPSPTAEELFERGDFAGAEAAYRARVKKNRRDSLALNDLGATLVRLGREKEAFECFKRATEIRPRKGSLEHAAAYRNWAFALGELNRLDEAEQKARAAIDAARGQPFPAAWNTLGLILLRAEKLEESVEAFHKAVTTSEGAAPSERANWQLNYAATLFNAKRWRESLRAYHAMVKTSPQDARGWNGLGLLLKTIRRPRAAIGAFERAGNWGTDDLRNWAGALRDLGRHAEGEAMLRRARDIDPADADIHHELGLVLTALGNDAEAIKEYERAYATWREQNSSNQNVALFNWAAALLRLDDPRQAEQKLLDISTDDADRQRLLGSARTAQARYALATKDLRAAVDRWQDDKWLRHELGRALSGQGLFEEAIAEFEKVNSQLSQGDEDRKYVLWGLGNALVQIEKFEEARKCYADALRVSSSGDLSRFLHAFALEMCGKIDDALQEYTKAIEDDPSHPYPYHDKANLLFRLGRYDEGWKLWNHARRCFEAGQAALSGGAGSPALSKSDAVDRAVYFANILRDVFVDYGASKTWYELALAKDPDHIGAICGLAILLRRWSHRAGGGIEVQMRAGQVMREACERLSAVLDRPDRYFSLMVLADLHIEARDWDRLQDVLDRAEPECREMRLRRAEVLKRRGMMFLGKEKPHEAANAFEQALIDDMGDFGVHCLRGAALLEEKRYYSALQVFCSVLQSSPGNIDALIGAARAGIELADEGDTDYYERAEQHLTAAIEHGRNRGSGSRRLANDTADMADIYYMRGYAKTKRYEADRARLPVLLIASARSDFLQSLRTRPDHNLARSAIGKLDQNLRRHLRSAAEIFGQFAVFTAGAFIFTFAQIDFPLRSLSLHRALGLPAESLLGTGYYLSLTFGALAIMIAALSLPKLLTLKVPGIELRTASLDQVASPLGIRRAGLFENFLRDRLRGLNATPRETGKPGEPTEPTKKTPLPDASSGPTVAGPT